MSLMSDFVNKDILIFLLLFIILLCIWRIFRLKRLLAQEIQKRLYPQLTLELISDIDTDNYGFYLQNESSSVLRDIKVKDAEVALTDAGFTQILILRFEQVDFLKPKEKIKLTYQVFDRQNTLLPQMSENIIPHLLNTPFQVRINYSTTEGHNLLATFAKKGNRFYLEKIV